MKFPPYLSRQAAGRSFGLFTLVLAAVLGGCTDDKPLPEQLLQVRVETPRTITFAREIKLTGEIAARAQIDLSFRTAGRVIAWNVDVGALVREGDILARLDQTQQQASIEAAETAVSVARTTLRQAQSNHERQRTLLVKGFTTRRDFDTAVQALSVAEGTLDGAQAQLAIARDQLDQTILKAPSAGVITARNLEIGQVVNATQPVLVLAQDGPRDAVVSIPETLMEQVSASDAEVSLISASGVRATGRLREVAPAATDGTGTVLVKIQLQQTPPDMLLGAAVTVALKTQGAKRIIIPQTALFSDAGLPSVWIVDPDTKRVSLRPVSVDSFETSAVIIRGGLEPEELLVTVGANMLHPNQKVSIDQGGSS